mgnify:CR=1 FL=1
MANRADQRMADEKPTESARHQAQDLAYKAMGARDPEEAIRLCVKAIEIAPRCVDALARFIHKLLNALENRHDLPAF